jgi:hypothetical protein
MAHDEFPPLTRVEIEVLQSGNRASYLNLPGELPGGVRPFAAAVIREAVKQAAPFHFGTMQVVAVGDLLQIAQNLHDTLPPPPTPPTREELGQALLELETWERFSEIRTTEWFKERFAVLRRGIAHHCKVQP